MEVDVVYVLAIIFQAVSETTFGLVTEPVKMTIEKCIEIAAQINVDPSHPYNMACVPFTEEGVGV